MAGSSSRCGVDASVKLGVRVNTISFTGSPLASPTYIEMLGVADKDVSAACAHERVTPASKRALDVNVPVIKLVMLNVLALRWEVKKIESANDMDLINNVLFLCIVIHSL